MRPLGGLFCCALIAVGSGSARADATAGAAEATAYHVGLDFLDVARSIPELPQAQLVGLEWLVEEVYEPFLLTAPTTHMVADGGLAGWLESDVREAIRFGVESAYREIPETGLNSTLSLSVYNGRVPETAEGRRLNVVLGSNALSGGLYGWALISAAFNVEARPNDAYSAAIFLDSLDGMGAEPGVAFDTSEKALNHLIGTIAHEVAHLFGLGHQPAGDSEPYALMAVGGTGLTSAMRLTKRQFNAESSAILAANLPKASRGDFNLDGDVDVFQFDGGGDAQILTSHLGLASLASFSQGDANSDGDVDVFQIDGQGDAQLLVSLLSFDAPQGSAELRYNPAAQEFVLEVGAGIGMLALAGPAGAGALNPLATFGDLGAPQQVTGDSLALFAPQGVPAGSYDVTDLLAGGASLADLQLYYTPLGSLTQLGAIIVVPEPASAALVVASALIFAMRGASRRDARHFRSRRCGLPPSSH